jgi:hypothetical protein
MYRTGKKLTDLLNILSGRSARVHRGFELLATGRRGPDAMITAKRSQDIAIEPTDGDITTRDTPNI